MHGAPRIGSIVIAGGGTAGWMAAAALARFLGGAVRITLVESDAIGTVGVGEATIPQIRLFNQGLGIDEAEFVAATQGSFKLGIVFDGWRAPDARYIHAFGTIGRPLGLLPFTPYWLRARAEGVAGDLWDHSATARAAFANRFAAFEDRPGAPPSGVAHAFQFDASLYAAYLRRYAEARGVTRIEGRIAGVERDGESSRITALRLDGDATASGDLFIDCTGFRSLLLGETMGVGFDNWSHWLPCDRALAVPCTRVDPLTPYTRATARDAGWQWRIPLQHRTGNWLVYASAAVSDDDAAATLLANLDGEALDEPRPLRFTAGRRRAPWAGNVVALGLAAGFLEPLESTSIHLIQSGIARLLQLFPTADFPAETIAEFNRQSAFEWEAVRDFIILHYNRNDRPGDFWAQLRAMEVPDRLANRIALFAATGTINRDSEELFTEVAWTQVMLGQGVVPRAWHPLADALTRDQLAEFMALASRHAETIAGRLPDHAAFLARHCAAPAAPIRSVT